MTHTLFYSQAELLQAAGYVNGTPYAEKVQHVGGHGPVTLLAAEQEPHEHPAYLVFRNPRGDGVYVGCDGDQWGEYDAETMAELVGALERVGADDESDIVSMVLSMLDNPLAAAQDLRDIIDASPPEKREQMRNDPAIQRLLNTFDPAGVTEPYENESDDLFADIDDFLASQ